MQNVPTGAAGEAVSAPKLKLQGNVQSLFGELDSRAHKVRVLADVVGESLTNDIDRVGEPGEYFWRLPYREGARTQDLALIVVEEADRLIDELDAARVFYTQIERATAEPDPSSDPLLKLIERYRVAVAELDAEPEAVQDDDAAYDRIVRPHYEVLRNSPPTPTSMRGAVEAIREAHNFMRHSHGGYERPLIGAALAFLEGRA